MKDASDPRRYAGELAGGGGWALEVPAGFNGIVCLYSAGYGGGQSGSPDVAGDPSVRRVLLDRGFALAGTRTATRGWIVGDALVDQTETLESIRIVLGDDARYLAWGHSMGGLIAAGLAERVPDLIDGAVPFCASVAGAVPMLNQGLDAAFALTVLGVADDGSEVVRVTTDDMPRLLQGRDVIARARRTPVGRARVALASALAQLPAWTVDNMFAAAPWGPEPTSDDLETILANQASVLPYVAFSPRADLERRAGGNFSWNAGIDYRRQLAESGFAELVGRAYADAGADLEADLRSLDAAPRIEAEPHAVAYMEQNLTPDGCIGVPVLTVALTGDFAPTVTQSAAYADVVEEAGRSHLLEQVYLHAPGHCSSLAAAHVVAGIETMATRLSTGAMPSTTPESMNRRSREVASAHGLDSPAGLFVKFSPHPHLRPHPRRQRVAALTEQEPA